MLLAVSTSAGANMLFGRGSPLIALAVLGAVASLATACGISTPSDSAAVRVVATENFWGSIATQLAGSQATVRSIITNPQTDPHAYEPTASDARAIAGADFVIENGAGYDPWAQKLIDANPSTSRSVLDVRKLIAGVTAQLQRLDSADSTYFATQHDTYVSTGLKQYDDLRAAIKQQYS